jgi:hypothetical protein
LHRTQKLTEALFPVIPFLTLYDGIIEEIFSNVNGPISAGVQPKQSKSGKITGIRNLQLLQVIAYLPRPSVQEVIRAVSLEGGLWCLAGASKLHELVLRLLPTEA